MREIRNSAANYLAEKRSIESLRAAIDHTPADATKWRQLAIALLQRQQTEHAMAALARAAQLNPFESDARLGLAVEQERQGRTEEAGRYYLDAANRSKRFKPQAALAGFYFRSGRMPQFWDAATTAVNVQAADVTPVIRLAHATGAPSDRVLQSLRLRSPNAQTAYLQFALNNKLFEEAASVAGSLPIQQEYHGLLLAACDRFIAAGRSENAVALWNRLARNGVLRLGELNPRDGQSLTNSGFDLLPALGFNWRLSNLAGVLMRGASGGGLAIEFSGEQPEHAEVLHQIAPVVAGRKYKLLVRYEVSDLTDPTGLALLVEPVSPAGPHPLAVAELGGSPAGTATTEFKLPPDCKLIRLALRYKRAVGTVRITGTLTLKVADLELLP